MGLPGFRSDKEEEEEEEKIETETTVLRLV
jgi:hypothetical protein